MIKISQRTVMQIQISGRKRDSELAGFYVQTHVSNKGKISHYYLVSARPKGARKNVSVMIGRHGVIQPEQARVEAKKILALLAQGINPNEEKKQKQQDQRKQEQTIELEKKIGKITLSQLLQDYLSARDLRERPRQDYQRLTHRCLHDWISRPVTAITRDMVQEKYLELAAEHPAQANYTMRILRALFTYAIAVYQDVYGKPLLTVNPVDRLKHARLWKRVPRRQTVIRPHQLKSWFEAVRKLKRLDARDILLIEIFTGLRHSEACGLTWRNIDFRAKTITVEDTKNHTDLMLPMSTFLETILEERHERLGKKKLSKDAYVFPSDGKKGYVDDIRDSIALVVEELGIKFTEHDLRRTFETTAESLDISYYTLKRLLNHKTGGDPTAGYIVTSAERLREAAQKVAAYLAKHMGLPEPASTKTAITSKAPIN